MKTIIFVKYMRLIFFLFFSFLSSLLFAQTEATIKEINQLIGPAFYFDTSKNGFYDNFYHEQQCPEKIITILAWNPKDTDEAYPTLKVFVFERNNSKLNIIDSSTSYERDGKGPRLFIAHDTLKIQHGFHGGYYSLYYTFNKERKKYLLVSIEFGEVIKDKKYNNVPIGWRTENYDIKKRELVTTIKPVDDNRIKARTTITKKALPQGLIPDLAHFIDPLASSYGDNRSDIYNKIF